MIAGRCPFCLQRNKEQHKGWMHPECAKLFNTLPMRHVHGLFPRPPVDVNGDRRMRYLIFDYNNVLVSVSITGLKGK